MQFNLTFSLEMQFDYAPAEYELGHLFQRERMELSNSNLDLSDEQVAMFEEQALDAFKAEKSNRIASRAYDIYLDGIGAY